MAFIFEPIRTLNNNYAWLLADGETAVVVDPGEAGPVLKALAARGLELGHILLTHLHPDHCGGTAELKQRFPKAMVAMHREDAARVGFAVDRPVEEGTELDCDGLIFKVMHLPCHTRGCVAWQYENYLFTGDTLFTAGCGKFFEGTTAEMRANLERLQKLDPELLVCCGHEYTIENLEYAVTADPGNRALADRLAETRPKAAAGEFLVPARLGLELATNPFLRLDDPGLQKSLKTSDELETLQTLYKIYYQESPPNG